MILVHGEQLVRELVRDALTNKEYGRPGIENETPHQLFYDDYQRPCELKTRRCIDTLAL